MSNEPNYDSRTITFRVSLRNYAMICADATASNVTVSDIVRDIINSNYSGRELTESELTTVNEIRQHNIDKRTAKRNKKRSLINRFFRWGSNGS